MKTSTLSKYLPLILLAVVTLTTRFYELGTIPKGLSLEEATIGLSLAPYLGGWVLNPILIRLASAILGTLSIFLLYFLVNKLSENLRLSYASAFLLSITPWHIQESRIFSVVILIIFTTLFFGFILSDQLKSLLKFLPKFFVALSILLFISAILINFFKVSEKVDAERRIAVNAIPLKLTTIYSNKLVESYRENLASFYEHLDFGVYFFNGHPRQRWGVEETTKLFVSFIPLIIIGITKLKNDLRLLLGAVFIFLLTLLTLFEFRGPSESLPLVFIFVIIAGYGLNYLWEAKKRQTVFYILLILLFYEFLNFNSLYFSGLTESTFSPRRAVYEEIAGKVSLLREENEKVLVNERLLNPKIFFQFYLKDQDLEGFEFKEYNVWNEQDSNALFVDVLPYEPSPSETLYTKEDGFPEKLTPLYEISDERLRQKVFVYRYAEN